MRLKLNNRNNNQPDIRVGRTLEGTIFELVTAVLVVIMWIVAIVLWSRSPETVPTHFDISGSADSYGDRATMLIVPAIGTIVSLLLLVSAYRPAKMINMPVNVRTPRQFMIVIRMTRILAVVITLMFISITLMTAFPSSKLPFIFLMTTFVCMIAILIYFTIKVGRAKDK